MKQFSILIISTLITAVLISGFVIIPSETSNQFNNSDPLSGEQLARIYCAMCHKFPTPDLLDKATWKERVLPNMGWRLGIRKQGDDPYKNVEKDEADLIKVFF